MTFATGSLVRARGREWIVLPQSSLDLLVLRPLGGTDRKITGIYVGAGRSGKPLEVVASAAFPPPSVEQDLGNHLSGRTLCDAVRLGFRSAAGPFRSLAHLGVELMALRLDPVRIGCSSLHSDVAPQ